LNSSGAGASVPSSAFFDSSLKKVIAPRFLNTIFSGSFYIVVQEVGRSKQTDKGGRRGLAYNTSDDRNTPQGDMCWIYT